MAYPTPPQYKVNQGFRSYATAGVVGRPDGTELQYLVWLYGDYQAYGHAGADIACPIGTPVYAVADGIVVWADWGSNLPGDDSWGPSGYFKRWGMYKNFPGICTVIWHPQLNKFSIYGHLSSNDIAPVGTKVKAAQQIALSGNTKAPGETVGPHLHIAVVGDFTNYSTGGKYIFGCEDPVPYFSIPSAAGITYQSITTSEEDIFMALTDKEQARILAAADRINGVITDPNAKVLTTNHVADIVAQTASAILNTPIQRGGQGAALGDGKTSLGALAAWNDDHVIQILAAAAAGAVSDGASVDDIKAAVTEAMAKVVKVQVTVEGGQA